MAFWRTPVIALMPDIIPSQFRSQANGVINLMGGLGAIVSFLIGAKLYEMNKAYPFWLGSVLVILSSLLVFIFIKEPKVYEASEEKPSLLVSLKEVMQSRERSALRILLAIFFWFLGYNAVEAFFTLYANKHLGLPEADGARLLGQLSLLFVIFALPSGYLGARYGRRKTILTGLTLMTVVMLAIFFLPKETLTTFVTKLPVLGVVPVIGLFLMLAGIAWACININSLPMVVDMTDAVHLGTYTGLYYLFSTLAAIAGPNVNGWIIQLSNGNYNTTMMIAPFFMIVAFLMMMGVRRGEAQVEVAAGSLAKL
jgi:maltose/moltooligosaccharide transporter